MTNLQYQSTSLHEIFAHRVQEQTQSQENTNQFIKPITINKDANKESALIFSQNKAYQSKVIYQAENYYNENSTDNQVIQKQPFETLTSVGYGRSLTQLPTDQLTRKSDPLVTSSLSFSWVRKDKKGNIKHFSKLSNDQLVEYANERENFRASQLINLNQQIYPDKKLYLALNNVVSNQGFQNIVSTFKSLESQRSSRMNGTQLKSFFTISQNKVSKSKTSNFKSKQLKLSSYSQNRKTKQQIKNNTNSEKYSLQDAIKMFNGLYYKSDEEDDDKKNNDGDNELIGPLKRNNDALQYSKFQGKILLNLKDVNLLQEFEKDQRELKDLNNINEDQEQIPQTVRDELNLPEDMENQELDIEEIRKYDSQIRKKKPIWSGQDVIPFSIDLEQSLWVLEKINAVRVWPKGMHGYVKRFRAIFKYIVRTPLFENFMILAVIANTIILSLDRYGISTQQSLIANKMNAFFTYLFISELGSKLIALGITRYLSEKMNYLDATVVILSIIELIFLSGGSGKSSLSAFRSVRIFRTFRVLRVARLLKSMRSMQIIMGVIGRSIVSFIYISILLILFIFIYSLLGMQFYGNMWNFKDIGLPRQNYNSFSTAFLTSFQIMTLEKWPLMLYYGLKSDVLKPITLIYFISWIVVGNYILRQLYLATIIDAFMAEDQEQLLQDQEDEKNQNNLKNKSKKFQKKATMRREAIGKTTLNSDRIKKNQILNLTGSVQPNQIKQLQIDEEENIEDMDEDQIMEIFREQGMTKDRTLEQQYESLFKNIECKNSLYILTKKIISAKIDIAVSIIFLMEATTKIISMGMVLDNGSYLRDTWNMLDFFIVICSLIDMIFSHIHLPFIKVLRLLRTLRPLRFISHNVGLKMLVIALFESIGPIANVLIVIFLIFLMFAILGVNLWSGKFFQCSIQPYEFRTQQSCFHAQGTWIEYVQNFDSVPQAMLTLFAVATLENWQDVAMATKDATAVDLGPIINNCQICPYFFFLFIMIGTFFFLNFFIGVLYLNYTKAKEQENQGLTKKHLCWLDMQTMILKAGPDFESLHVPKQRFRKFIYKIVTNQKFDFIIMGCIVLNMIQMALLYEGASSTFLEILNKINIIFTVVFAVECILKLIAYGKFYFIPAWHKFDFFVVTTSLFDIFIDAFLSNSNSQINFLRMGPQLARILRVLRVSRLLKFLNKYQGLQALIQTISFSLPELMNVFGLLLLVLFMFSVLGVFFFNDIIGSNIMGKSYINDQMNFANVGNAMIILFRCATGEDWNYIMYSLMEVQTGANCHSGGTCGNQLSFIYFIIFIIMFKFVFTNLFVLVVLQQFDKYYLPKDNIISQFKTNLQNFKDVWKQFTLSKYGCLKLNENQLLPFFQQLKEPLGMPGVVGSDLKKALMKMGIRSEEGYIYFNELLYRCMKRAFGNLKLNKQLQIIELKTQYKICQMTMNSHSKGKYSKNQEIFSKMLGKAKSVNPFLTIMFLKMSFKLWLNITQRILKQNKLKKRLTRMSTISPNLNILAKEQDIQQQFDQENENNMVYIDLYEEEILYLSSDSSNSDNDSSSSQSLDSSSSSSSSDGEESKYSMTSNQDKLSEFINQEPQTDRGSEMKDQQLSSGQIFKKGNLQKLSSLRNTTVKVDNEELLVVQQLPKKRQSKDLKKIGNKQKQNKKKNRMTQSQQYDEGRSIRSLTYKSRIGGIVIEVEDLNKEQEEQKVIYEVDDEPLSGMIRKQNKLQ